MTQPPYGPPTSPAQVPGPQPGTWPANPPAVDAAPGGKKPLYKRRWAQVVGGVFLVGVIGSALSDGDAAPADGSAAAPAVQADAAVPSAEGVVDEGLEAPEPATPGIGATVADGDFSFVVTGVDCSTTEIGDQYFSTTAQGQFCIVDLTIANVGNSAQSFFGENATLLNAEGQEFSADGEAAIYLPDSSSLYEEINPGNTLSSRVVFDVPAGMVPTAIELHDSMFSGGVTVALA